MDLVGYASFAIPAFGEFSDVIWAPLSAFIFYQMFGGKTGMVGAAVSFTEEILPFTDWIPTFSIGWLWSFILKKRRESGKDQSPVKYKVKT